MTDCEFKRVNIYYIRHGYSCANIVKTQNQNKKIARSHTFYKDPELSTIGIKHTQSAKEFIEDSKVKFDIIASSPLLRAIQTANILFKDQIIEDGLYIFPYVLEKSSPIRTPDNTVKFLKDLNKIEKIVGIPKHNLKDYSTFGDGRKISNINLFTTWLGQYLCTLLYSLKKYHKEEINIALVTHGGFMRDNFQMDEVKNNDIIKVKYNFKNNKLTKENTSKFYKNEENFKLHCSECLNSEKPFGCRKMVNCNVCEHDYLPLEGGSRTRRRTRRKSRRTKRSTRRKSRHTKRSTRRKSRRPNRRKTPHSRSKRKTRRRSKRNKRSRTRRRTRKRTRRTHRRKT